MKKNIYFIIISALIIIPFNIVADSSINNLFSNEGTSTASNVIVNNFDLVWSVDTYTPFEYIGRALPIAGSKITINAIIKVSSGDIKGLKYSWFLEDIFQKDKSGYGKTSFYFYAKQKADLYHNIRLQIFNEDRTVFLEKSIQIPITKPEVVIYPSNGNSYFFNQENKIPTVVSGRPFSFMAKPYFFSIEKLTDLVFEWNVAGQSPIISSKYNASVLDLSITNKNTNAISKQDLRVNVKNLKAEEQNAFKSIKINIY